MNDEFPSQLLNLFITGGCICFGEYHIRWKCGLIKLCTCLNCVSIQVFFNNRSRISSLIHRNGMILHSISMDQARYSTSIVAKYLDNATVKTSTNFYKTTLPSDIIFTKADTSTSDEQVENLTRGLNIHYRSCIGSFIYVFSTRVDLSFSLHKFEKFSANPGKVHF